MRQALASLGRDERVFSLDDNLAYGPIAPPTELARADWVAQYLSAADWHHDPGTTEMFWREAMSGASDKIFWVCRKSAPEYCGFLECIARIGDQSYLVVDATNERFAHSDGQGTYAILGLGELAPDAFLRNRLFESARPLTQAERETDLATWQRLRMEDAPFRIMTAAGLISAPLNHFDAALLSFVTPEWQKFVYVIGSAMAEALDTGFHNEDDFVLASRLRTLAKQGRIELHAAGPRWADIRVRMPPPD